MKSFILSVVAVSALWLGGAMTSTADAQYRVYRPVYGAQQYNSYYGGYGQQQTYYRGGYSAYPSGGYRTYYGGYGGGPYNGGYYNGGYYNAPVYSGYRGYNAPYYNGGYYSQPGVTIGVGGARVGFGF